MPQHFQPVATFYCLATFSYREKKYLLYYIKINYTTSINCLKNNIFYNKTSVLSHIIIVCYIL